jgi:hypothetical protein
VQWVARRGSLITLVVTPAANALDDDLAVSDSKEDTNLTDSITRDDVRNELRTRPVSLQTNSTQTEIIFPGYNYHS